MRSRRSSIVFWIGPNANRLSTKNVIPNAISVQIIRPGTTSISPPESSSGAVEQAADQAVEDDRLGEGEAQPLDAGQLAPQLRLPRDCLDHRAEDVADADPGAERAQADPERERDRLAGVGDVAGRLGEEGDRGHVCSGLLS